MGKKHIIEIFTKEGSVSKEMVEFIDYIACPSAKVSILHMSNPAVADKARSLGIRSLPAIVIDGKLAK